ncbi:MAG: GAF domain-containing sensor histidine kinase [Egibacteraceae bacterium]
MATSDTADSGARTDAVASRAPRSGMAWWLAGACVAATVVLAGAAGALAAVNGIGWLRATTDFLLLQVVLSVVFAGVGALIIAHRPTNRVGWLLCAAAVGMAVPALTGQYARLALVTYPGAVPGGRIAAWLSLWTWVPGFTLVLVGLPLLFPDGRPPSVRWHAVGWAGAAGAVLVLAAQALAPGAASNLPQVGNPFAVAEIAPVLQVVSIVGWVMLLAAVTAALASVVVRYRRAGEAQRRPLKWFAYAAMFVLLAEVGGPALTLLLAPGLDVRAVVAVGETVTAPLLAVAVGVAILRDRLYDIDVLLSRTLVYAVLTAAVVGLYVLVVGYFGAAFQLRGDAISLVAAGVVAVAFQPLRERVQRGVNRLVYGQRDEPYAALARLGQRLESTLAPDTVLPTIAATVRESLRLPYVAITMPDAAPVESGTPRPVELRIPLVAQRRQIGELALAARSPGEAFGDADQRLLADFARQAGIAAHAVRLTADLQRARERLVATREEERRRLRRDLHDGLGSQLASHTLTLDAARRAMGRDVRAADRLLDDLRAQTEAAVADIRRLIGDLRPATLDDLGLDGALRELADRYEVGGLQVHFEACGPLSPLPAAVEVAAYRIAQEALTNVARHADAHRCTVHVTVRDDVLTLTIRDDGQGVSGGHVDGLGLASMTERASELGGSCTVQAPASGGTDVRAVIPLEQESLHGPDPRPHR